MPIGTASMVDRLLIWTANRALKLQKPFEKPSTELEPMLSMASHQKA
jgi:hypothetical protein